MCRAPGYLIFRRPHPVAPQPIRPTPVRPAAAEETFPLPIKVRPTFLFFDLFFHV
jgi:hypothetical protein